MFYGYSRSTFTRPIKNFRRTSGPDSAWTERPGYDNRRRKPGTLPSQVESPPSTPCGIRQHRHDREGYLTVARISIELQELDLLLTNHPYISGVANQRGTLLGTRQYMVMTTTTGRTAAGSTTTGAHQSGAPYQELDHIRSPRRRLRPCPTKLVVPMPRRQHQVQGRSTRRTVPADDPQFDWLLILALLPCRSQRTSSAHVKEQRVPAIILRAGHLADACHPPTPSSVAWQERAQRSACPLHDANHLHRVAHMTSRPTCSD